MNKPMTPEERARQFHELYEKAAPTFGYETRGDTKIFDPESFNGRLMVYVVSEMDAARDKWIVEEALAKSYFDVRDMTDEVLLMDLQVVMRRILAESREEER